MSSSAITVNYNSDGSSISFYANTELVTIYTYSASRNTVTMKQRNNTHSNTLEGYKSGLVEVKRWLTQLEKKMPIRGKQKLTEYQLNVSYSDNPQTLTHTYYINKRNVGKIDKKKNLVMKAMYSFDTKLVTFYPRDSVEINLSDFIVNYEHAVEFLRHVGKIAGHYS